MQATVRDAMSTDVVAVTALTSIADAEQILLRFGLDELFVKNEQDQLCGIVPDYALLKQRLVDAAPSQQPIESIMTRRFLVVTPESSLRVAGRYLREHVHRRLAVVEDMRLIGQVTRHSVLTLLAAEAASSVASVTAPPHAGTSLRIDDHHQRPPNALSEPHAEPQRRLAVSASAAD